MVGNVHVTLSQRVVKVTKSTIGDEKVAVLNHLVYTYIYIYTYFFSMLHAEYLPTFKSFTTKFWGSIESPGLFFVHFLVVQYS